MQKKGNGIVNADAKDRNKKEMNAVKKMAGNGYKMFLMKDWENK